MLFCGPVLSVEELLRQSMSSITLSHADNIFICNLTLLKL